jgi:hypothetical protein
MAIGDVAALTVAIDRPTKIASVTFLGREIQLQL